MPLERKVRRIQAAVVISLLASILAAYLATLGSSPFVGKILRYLFFLPSHARYRALPADGPERRSGRSWASSPTAYDQLQDNMVRLRQAERLSATGQLAASLAHEIRTPLASIEGAAEMLDGAIAPGLRT